MTTPENARRPDGTRITLSILLTAGLSVAIAALFVHYSPQANDEGATAAALGDAFTWILGVFVTAGAAIGAGVRRIRAGNAS